MYGFSFIDNFLPEERLKDIKNEFLKIKKDKFHQGQYGSGVNCITKNLPDKYIEYFSESISAVTKELIGKNIILNQITMQRLKFIQEESSDPNTILHIDRFLPCIKIFYFPNIFFN